MCGLAGNICFGTARPTPEILRHMLVAQEIRGRDAAGVAYQKNGEIMALKRPLPPRSFVEVELNPKILEEMAASSIVLLHARHATQGSEKENENNHPVLACDWVVTHNGHVTNDDDLVAYYGMEGERPAEVDTVAINMALAQGETTEESLSHISLLGGKATFTGWNVTRPHELLMARVNGPALYLHYDKNKNILFWSSDTDGLQKTASPGIGTLGFLNVAVMPQNTAFIFSEGSVKQYSLNVQPFVLPKPIVRALPAKTTKEGDATRSPLTASSQPETQTFGQTQRSTIPIIGTTYPPPTTVSEPGRQPPHGLMGNLAATMTRWLSKVNGDSDSAVMFFDKEMKVTCHEDYPALGKPGPQFEAGMLGLAGLPPIEAAELRTPYGTWRLTPNNRWFYGAKRVKKFWEERIYNTTGTEVMLPATVHLAQKLQDKFKLEVIRIYHSETSNHIALMCPMCGIITKPVVWKDWGYSCQWCGIKSHLKAPRNEGVRE